jgi:hypothetical protein
MMRGLTTAAVAAQLALDALDSNASFYAVLKRNFDFTYHYIDSRFCLGCDGCARASSRERSPTTAKVLQRIADLSGRDAYLV